MRSVIRHAFDVDPAWREVRRMRGPRARVFDVVPDRRLGV